MRLCRQLVCLVVATGMLAGCLKEYVYERLPGEVVGELETPAGLDNLSAQTCGSCHVAIYEEWAQSGMGKAWTDPVFQADFEREHQVYVCRNCHSPLQQQRPERIHGLSSLKPITGEGVPNPSYDQALRDEGVTCAACHVSDGLVVGSIAGTDPPHAHRVEADFGSAELCEGCHQAEAPPLSAMERPIADVVGEWRSWKQATGRTEECKDCHMPEVERPLTAWTEPRRSGSHAFPGAWSTEFVRTAIQVSNVGRTASSLNLTLTNLAGHRFPTDDPLRAVIITGSLALSPTTSRTRTVLLERVVEPKTYRELRDTTLGPAESRTISLDFSPSDLAAATAAQIRIEWAPLFHAHPAVHAVRPEQPLLFEFAVP